MITLYLQNNARFNLHYQIKKSNANQGSIFSELVQNSVILYNVA